MKETKNMFLNSAKELKSVPALAMSAMLAALALILNSVATINLGPYIKIGFSGIPNQIVDYLFGPVTGGLFAGILDIVKYFMRPDGGFFFGFTFNAMLAAFIYGCFYYRQKLTLKRVLIAKLVVILIVNVLLNTLWLDMLYGKGFLAILPLLLPSETDSEKSPDCQAGRNSHCERALKHIMAGYAVRKRLFGNSSRKSTEKSDHVAD